jgi:hypothetical protein
VYNTIKIKSNKPFILIGHIIYLFLFLFAGYFYLERILYADAAYYTFKMVNFSSFNIELNRYASVLYELPSYLALKMGLSLRTIVFLFSLSVILVSYLGYILCIHYFKNVVGGFIILLLNFIGVSSSFFFPISELNIGLIFCIVLYAWLEKRNNFRFDITTIFIGTLIIIASILSHPGVAPVVVFIFGFYMIKYQKVKNLNFYALFLIFLTCAIWKSFQLQTNKYESDVMAHLNDFSSFLVNFKHAESVKYYFYHPFKVYFINHLVFIITVLIFYKQKKNVLLSYYILSYIGILFFYLLLYNAGDPTVMMQKAFSPITIILFLPFLSEIIFVDNKMVKTKACFLVLIAILGFERFIESSKDYVNYIGFIDKITSEAKQPKKVMFYNKDNKNQSIISWAIGVETLLYSSLDSPQNSKTVYFIKKGEKLDSVIMSKPNTFLCVTFWPYWNTKEFNKKYFELPLSLYAFEDEHDNSIKLNGN